MIKPDVLVVGGGVVGLSVGLQLAERGARVTVLDRGEMGLGCSFGNAGLIPPSFCEPLATPAALVDGLRGLFNPEHPLRLRVRADWNWTRWLLRFVGACRWSVAQTSTRVLTKLCVESLTLLTQWADRPNSFWLRREGWLHVYRTVAGLEAGVRQGERLKLAGVRPVLLGPAEARELEPNLSPEISGAIHFPEDAHLDPFLLIRALSRWAMAAGARLESGAEVTRIRMAGERVVAVVTQGAEYSADRYVICAGAWSARILEQVAGWIPIESGLGTSLTFDDAPVVPRLPIMFAEGHVVATPMERRLRMTTGMELGGFRAAPSERSVAAIRRAAREGLPSSSPWLGGAPWSGHRPMTPDGLPIVGPIKRAPNLYLASGHGTLGVALAAVTGKLICEAMQTREIPVGMEALLPGRFGARPSSGSV